MSGSPSPTSKSYSNPSEAAHDISFDQNHNEEKISRGSSNSNPSNVTLQTDSASNSEPLQEPEPITVEQAKRIIDEAFGKFRIDCDKRVDKILSTEY